MKLHSTLTPSRIFLLLLSFIHSMFNHPLHYRSTRKELPPWWYPHLWPRQWNYCAIMEVTWACTVAIRRLPTLFTNRHGRKKKPVFFIGSSARVDRNTKWENERVANDSIFIRSAPDTRFQTIEHLLRWFREREVNWRKSSMIHPNVSVVIPFLESWEK